MRYALPLCTALVIGVASPPSSARAEPVFISPGLKLAYSFGTNGGFSYGFEISVLAPTNDPDHPFSPLFAAGGDLNFTWTSRGAFSMRLGGELVSAFVGLEAGPELMVENGVSRFSLGITPWVGFFYVIPYFTYHLVFGGPDLGELGSYLKLPLCAGCSDGATGHQWEHHHD